MGQPFRLSADVGDAEAHPVAGAVGDGQHDHRLPANRMLDHLAGDQVAHRLAHHEVGVAVGATHRPRPRRRGCALGRRDRCVLDDVAELAGRPLLRPGDALLEPIEPCPQPHQVGVGLKLGEAPLKHAQRLVPLVAGHQVDHHVVGGVKGRVERVLAAARQRSRLVEGDERRPGDDGEAQLVDAPTARPAGELGELGRGQKVVPVAGVLGQLVDHHGAGGHVDAEGQRLGGEHHLDQPQGEGLLDRLLEGGHHPGMVGGHSGLQRRHPAVVAQHLQVGCA